MSENVAAKANDLILRCQWEAYMECTTGENTGYNLIGEGFTSFPETKNPQEYSRKYINYRTEKTDVIGYSPSIEYSADVIYKDPVVDEIVYITDNELLGTDTHRNIVSVNTWEQDENGACKAFLRTYAIIPGGKGDGTEAMIYTGTMKAVSDQVEGTFNLDSKTFTVAPTETPAVNPPAVDPPAEGTGN